mmetsp:Transcript_11780/g.35818  ORF Transcript_11780/g.35818 Transcript_11780/m.35818 type:complete len:244 (-) Transcript_11780:915-1646(-)
MVNLVSQALPAMISESEGSCMMEMSGRVHSPASALETPQCSTSGSGLSEKNSTIFSPPLCELTRDSTLPWLPSLPRAKTRCSTISWLLVASWESSWRIPAGTGMWKSSPRSFLTYPSSPTLSTKEIPVTPATGLTLMIALFTLWSPSASSSVEQEFSSQSEFSGLVYSGGSTHSPETFTMGSAWTSSMELKTSVLGEVSVNFPVAIPQCSEMGLSSATSTTISTWYEALTAFTSAIMVPPGML